MMTVKPPDYSEETDMRFVTELKPNQVFVFGSNGHGFHGAGSAGYAMLGVSGNQWRTAKVPGTEQVLTAVPNGTMGKWAVKGTARGPMRGRDGMSYAIQTVTRPGAKRSIPLHEIEAQLVELWRYAEHNSKLEFLMTPIGGGYSGYTGPEMTAVFNRVIKAHGLPSNITLDPNMYSKDQT